MDSQTQSQSTGFRWQSFSLKTLIILVTGCAIFFAYWRYQYERGTVNEWIDLVLVDVDEQDLTQLGIFGLSLESTSCPRDITSDEQLRLLMKSTRWLTEPERRRCALKIIVEQFPDRAHESCIELLSKEKENGSLKRDLILLVSLFQNKDARDLLVKFLDDESPEIQAATIDAISVQYGATYPVPAGFDSTWRHSYLVGKPPIFLEPIRRWIGAKPGEQVPVFRRHIRTWDVPKLEKLTSEISGRFRTMMVSSDSAQVVREAASRAMKGRHPDNYRLRVAEWGVWIGDGDNLTLAQSVIDEIPKFVHQSGDAISSIEEGRTNSAIIITKPIIHIEVDQPMVIDLSVKISEGRPWFGYPMPDDFSVEGTTGQFGDPRRFARDVPPELALDSLEGVREGYPWVGPQHTKKFITTVTGVGFRWQSLIALPEKADWMKLEEVVEKKYQWWNRLRSVPCSWVWSRGESERFLYYDGPTDHLSPVSVTKKGTNLSISVPQPSYNAANVSRQLLYIDVSGEEVTAVEKLFVYSYDANYTEFETKDRPLNGETAVERLTSILVDRGLTLSEAQGLVDCWRPQFFESDGKRLLTIFGKKEYNELCPISVSPDPTEFARVGIVLTEFE